MFYDEDAIKNYNIQEYILRIRGKLGWPLSDLTTTLSPALMVLKTSIPRLSVPAMHACVYIRTYSNMYVRIPKCEIMKGNWYHMYTLFLFHSTILCLRGVVRFSRLLAEV